MKKIIFLSVLFGIVIFGQARAQQSETITPQSQVNYDGQVPVDMDLDGLTDQAEIQIYKTDPNNSDTDGDGYFDGTETLSGTDALNAESIPGLPPIRETEIAKQSETPWAWYISRVSGLLGFALLYVSIFLGLTLRVSFLRKVFAPIYALQGHCWLAFQATLFAFVHGVALMFDKYVGFGLADVFIPFAAKFNKITVAFGVISFYLMVILTASSYARKYISYKFWRALHFLNIVLYIFSVAHAYYLGTDLQGDIARNVFVVANVLLVLMMFMNMFLRIREKIVRKNAITNDTAI